MNCQDIELFPCYSLNLREFLTSKGLRYKISALNPNNHKMFWLYIDDDILKDCLKIWKETRHLALSLFYFVKK